MAKEFSDNEACFAFVTEANLDVRMPTEVAKLNPTTGVLAKCMNYFYENNQVLRPNSSSRASSLNSPQNQDINNSTLKNTLGEAIGIFLHPDVLQSLFDFDISQSNYRANYNIRQFEIDKLLAYFRDSISVLLDAPELADDRLIENKLREFVILIAKRTNAPSELDFLAAIFSPNYATLEAVIQSNLYANLSVDELAKLCHMSTSSFKRKFKAIYNDTPMKYITHLKINKVKALLNNPHASMTDIAYETGFESIATFNRIFKKQTGLSPTAYQLSLSNLICR